MDFPVWVNGSEGGCIDPADRGLAYGDGVFETLRRHAGSVILYEDHLKRLSEGTQALGIAYDAEQLRNDLQRFLEVLPADCVIKIVVTRGCSGRGYLPGPDAMPTCVLSAHPLPPAREISKGISAGISTLRLGLQPRLAGYKHLNRLEQVLLRQELEVSGKEEALVCDMHGRVTEGVFSNVFLVREGRLHTPMIDNAGVRGVMRAAIIREAALNGDEVLQGHYGLEDFLAADEVFFCNSVNGVWPVRTLADHSYGAGAVTKRWQAFWQRLLEYR